MTRITAFVFIMAGLAACEPIPGGTSRGNLPPLPEEVIAAADPRFVGTARLLEDGCYWHVHENVVESTFLPLRTPDGRPICAVTAEERAARAAEEAAAAAEAAGDAS